MSDYEARIYVSPEIVLPSLTEIKVFVWQNYQPSDIYEEGRWEREKPSIDSWDRGGGTIDFEIHDNKVKVVTVRSSQERLMARATYFIAGYTKGFLQFGETLDTLKYNALTDLVPLFGKNFDLQQSFRRVEEFRGTLPKFFELNTPFLKDYAPKIMPSFIMQTRLPTLYASSTYPTRKIENWVLRNEGYLNFKNDKDVPEGFWACTQSAYTHQEWAFVLWKRKGRVFWFGSCYFHVYGGESRSGEITAQNLQKAIADWENGKGDMRFIYD